MNQSALNSIGVQSPVIEQVERLDVLPPNRNWAGSSVLPMNSTPGHAFPVKPKWLHLESAEGSAVGIKRIMTPVQAKHAGADYLVIGRPILAAENPALALDSILEEMQN